MNYKENEKNILKSIINSQTNLNNKLKFFLSFVMQKNINSSNTAALRKFCVVTGRNRGVLSNLKISRVTFKNFINSGFLNNFQKSTW